jgi:hypothetical protein
MPDRIRFTRASTSHQKAMSFEVDVDNRTIIGLFKEDNQSWTVSVSGKFPQDAITLKWSEFLEIVHELHKFIAIENEVLLHNNKNEED